MLSSIDFAMIVFSGDTVKSLAGVLTGIKFSDLELKSAVEFVTLSA